MNTESEDAHTILAIGHPEPRPRRGSRRAAIREAKIEAVQDAISRVRRRRRSIPRSWELGLNAEIAQLQKQLYELRSEYPGTGSTVGVEDIA